jgi:hypothetical protein
VNFSLVFIKEWALCKCFSTKLTFVWLLLSMGLCVAPEVAGCSKGLVTLSTFMGLLSSVDPDMDLESTSCSTRIVTLLT